MKSLLQTFVFPFAGNANMFCTVGANQWTVSAARFAALPPIVARTSLPATDRGGVFLSTNNGISWVSITSSGLPRESVSALAVCGTKLFAGFDCTGVWASTNKGTNWAPTGMTSGFNEYHTGCMCTT